MYNLYYILLYDVWIYYLSHISLKCIEYINSICQILYITLIVYNMYYTLNSYIMEGILQHILGQDSTREGSTKIQSNVQTRGTETFLSNIFFRWQML